MRNGRKIWLFAGLVMMLSVCLAFTASDFPRDSGTITVSHSEYGRNIGTITVSHSEYGRCFTEYTVNLKTCRAQKTDFDYRAENDEDALRPVAQKTVDFSIEKRDAFLEAARKNGFLNWKETYEGAALANYNWNIEIRFTDGTDKYIFGDESQPETYRAMGNAFLELTGEDVLLNY
jgi:hypothetical protein